MSHNVSSGLFWKLLERFGVFGVQFLLQILLARLLDPAYYGMLTMMTIFVTLSNVFIQSGFNTSLVQNKAVTEEDYSSVFWMTLLVAAGLYALLFFLAPVIASFYKMPQIVAPFRVLTLILFPGAFNSVQLAKVSREMDFRKIFLSTVGGVVLSGILGIVFAYLGFGLWALVIQSLSNVVISCFVMLLTVRWRPQFIFKLHRVAELFRYGWKLLVSGLIDTLYHELSSLIVGKKYDAATLGYYNRGLQFPQVLITPINNSIQSVLLPAMSQQQDKTEQVKAMVRKSITLGSYVIFPMMAGLAGVAEPLVKLLLTDKWLPCVPFLQVFCISYAFWPVHTSNLQAVNAMGRSDIFLKLEIAKKGMGVIFLCIGVFCFDSPMAIAICTTCTAPISIFINTSPNRKLIGYSLWQQLRDFLPALLLSLGMLFAVLLLGRLPLAPLPLLVLQVLTGGALYIAFSALFRLEGFRLTLGLLKSLRKR